MMQKTYTILKTLDSYEDRLDYLKLDGHVGYDTFGGHRYLNQRLYQSQRWRKTKREVILRDNGCDLGCPDRPINKGLIVHHINPITIEDVLSGSDLVYDLNNLICVSRRTHDAIHYRSTNVISSQVSERQPNDTIPWR